MTVNVAAAANADVVFNGTAAVTLPSGNTAAQPSSPVAGMVRYNSQTNQQEHYQGSAWRAIGDVSSTQTYTNKTLSGNTATNLISGSGTLTLNTSGTATVQSTAGTIPSNSYAAIASATTINAMSNAQSIAIITGSTATALNGISAGFLGQRITLVNTASSAITLAHASGSASAGNQIATPDFVTSVTIPAASSEFSSVELTYTTISGVNYWFITDSKNAKYLNGNITGIAPFAGTLGEQLISSVSSVNAPTTSNYGDLTSLSLTPGIWDVYGYGTNNWVAGTITAAIMGITPTSGNSSTGLTAGLTRLDIAPGTSTTVSNTFSLPAVRVLLSATTIYYLKYRNDYNSTAPVWFASLKAVRVG